MNILQKATKNLKDILITNYRIESKTKVLIIYDEKSTLSSLLKEASKLALEELKNTYEMLDFYSKDQENIVENIEENYKP